MRLHTFGGLWLALEDRTPAPVSQRRLALLAIVAAAGPKGVSRDRVLALLWADSTEERARHALAQLVYAMRRNAQGTELLSGDADLRLASTVGSDIGDFLAAAEGGRHIEAIALYTGPFLDAFHLAGAPEFEHWLDGERERLRRQAMHSVEAGACEAQLAGDWERAAEHGRRLLELDPLSPRGAEAYLQALLNSGGRTAALQFAHRYELAVRDELGAAPDQRVRDLIASARVRRGSDQVIAPAPATSTGPAQLAPSGVLPASPTHAHPVRRRLRAAATVVAALGASALLVMARQRAAEPETEPHVDAVMAWPGLAEGSPDSQSTAQAVLAVLQRHASRWLLSRSAVSAALIRMRRTDTAAIPDEATAREIAMRGGLHFVLVPALVRSNDEWTASYQIEEARAGTVVGSSEATAKGPTPHAALERLFSAARGELAVAVARAAPIEPMPDVTTASFEALQAYEGSHKLSARAEPGALAMMERAILLDSTFASAQASLAYSYWFLYDQERADVHASAALRNIQGLPMDERLRVERDVAAAREDWSAAILASRALVSLVPGSAGRWHALGQYLFFAHEYERAVAAYDSALTRATASEATILLVNRATVLARMGRETAAIADYELAFAQDSQLVHHPFVGHEYGVALVRAGEAMRARKIYELQLESVPRPGHAYRSLALLEVHKGRLAGASELLATAINASLATNDSLGAATGHVLAAAVFIARGLADKARDQLNLAEPFLLNRSAPYELRAHGAKLFARMGATTEAQRVVNALERKTTAVSPVSRARRLLARGEIFMASGRIDEARTSIEQALVLDPTNDIQESAAKVAYRDGAYDVAARRYETLGARRSIDWEGYGISEFGWYDAVASWEHAHRPRMAGAAARKFLTQWADPDPDIPALGDALVRRAAERPAVTGSSPHGETPKLK